MRMNLQVTRYTRRGHRVLFSFIQEVKELKKERIKGMKELRLARTCCARLCSSCVMAVLRSVLAIGDVLAAQLRGVACTVASVSVVLLVPVEAAVTEP